MKGWLVGASADRWGYVVRYSLLCVNRSNFARFGLRELVVLLHHVTG